MALFVMNNKCRLGWAIAPWRNNGIAPFLSLEFVNLNPVFEAIQTDSTVAVCDLVILHPTGWAC